jgi:hypothetical protein
MTRLSNCRLDIIKAKEPLASIGGLGVLRSWLLQRHDAFGQKAKDYGLPTHKALLIVGIPGSGESLTAKATPRKNERRFGPSTSPSTAAPQGLRSGPTGRSHRRPDRE